MVLIGDDLNFAQKFTSTAADGLSLIAGMTDPRAPQESAVVIDMMVTLQRGAKRLRARHIYSGAQNVLTAMHHADSETLSGRIENLGSVVTEYARGLEEVLQVPEAPAFETPKEKWETARNTLNELLPMASPETADMLSRLMRAPVISDAEATDAEINILPFDQVEKSLSSEMRLASTLADALSFKSESPAQDNTAPTLPERGEVSKDPTENFKNATGADDSPIVTLDAMMRDVVADALSVARNVGRTISLSYDMGDRALSECRAEDLRSRLGDALSQVIRQSLRDDRIGHIDINLAGEQLHIVTGSTALRLAIDPKTAPVAKPLITRETEQGIRAQLNALLDPISIHETAS